MVRFWTRWVLILMGLTLVAAEPLAAQQPQQLATGVRATRESLESALETYENAARSRAYSQELRERARREAAALRTRLQRGDFKAGDPIMLRVEGQVMLTDTFVVTPDRSLMLPTIGRVSLNGVLRSELEALLTEQIGAYVRDPVVTASSYMRLAVSGAVGRPGFHLMSPDMPLPDALMLPGLSATSKVEEIEIVRGRQRILGGEELQLAIRDGSTLQELGIRSGDQILVPARPQLQLSQGQLVRSLGLLSGFIFTLNRIF